MSYRAFKRLLGETSLERKCRFLFGIGSLLLLLASFSWYARQTEDLAYEQTTKTGGVLRKPYINKLPGPLFMPPPQGQQPQPPALAPKPPARPLAREQLSQRPPSLRG